MKLRLARGLAFVVVIVLVALVALQHVEDAVRADLARQRPWRSDSMIER